MLQCISAQIAIGEDELILFGYAIKRATVIEPEYEELGGIVVWGEKSAERLGFDIVRDNSLQRPTLSSNIVRALRILAHLLVRRLRSLKFTWAVELFC